MVAVLIDRVQQRVDIARTGGIARDRKNRRRTAVLYMARAIHLSQAVFGRSPLGDRPARDTTPGSTLTVSIERSTNRHRRAEGAIKERVLSPAQVRSEVTTTTSVHILIPEKGLA